MQSLKDICISKLTSLVAQRKLLLDPTFNLADYIGLVPNELLSYWSSNMQTELQKLAFDLISAKYFINDLGTFKGDYMSYRSNFEALEIVKKAHNLGLCQKFFKQKCHLCDFDPTEDNFCILCANNDGVSPIPCTLCYARKCEKFYQMTLQGAKDARVEHCIRDENNFLVICMCKGCCVERAHFWKETADDHRSGICDKCLIFGHPLASHPFYPLTEEEIKPEVKLAYYNMIRDNYEDDPVPEVS